MIPLTLWDAGIGFVYPRSKLTERRLQANNVKLDDAKLTAHDSPQEPDTCLLA